MTDAGRYGPDNFIDPNGKPVKNTPFEVRQNGVLSTLYTDSVRSSVADNPGMSDALGNISFYAEPGYYDLTVGETTLSVAVDTIGGSGITSLNVHEIPFPSIGTMPGAWQGHPPWNDDGPTIEDPWSSQDPNAFAVPFKGISPISAVTVWGNGFTAAITGSVLASSTVDPTQPIVTVPDWAKPQGDWTFNSCDAFQVRWAYMDGDEIWHVVRTDTNVVGQVDASGAITIPGGWIDAPPDGADSVIVDFGVSVWIGDVNNYAMPVGFALRAKTESFSGDATVDPDAGTILCLSGCEQLTFDNGVVSYQEGAAVVVVTTTATVALSSGTGDPIVGIDGTTFTSHEVAAGTRVLLQYLAGAWYILADSTVTSGGITVHGDLSGRGDLDQHPATAISYGTEGRTVADVLDLLPPTYEVPLVGQWNADAPEAPADRLSVLAPFGTITPDFDGPSVRVHIATVPIDANPVTVADIPPRSEFRDLTAAAEPEAYVGLNLSPDAVAGEGAMGVRLFVDVSYTWTRLMADIVVCYPDGFPADSTVDARIIVFADGVAHEFTVPGAPSGEVGTPVSVPIEMTPTLASDAIRVPPDSLGIADPDLVVDRIALLAEAFGMSSGDAADYANGLASQLGNLPGIGVPYGNPMDTQEALRNLDSLLAVMFTSAAVQTAQIGMALASKADSSTLDALTALVRGMVNSDGGAVTGSEGSIRVGDNGIFTLPTLTEADHGTPLWFFVRSSGATLDSVFVDGVGVVTDYALTDGSTVLLRYYGYGGGYWDLVLDTSAGGGGAVSSVNSQTGDVVLTAADVGADPAGTAAALVDDLSGVTNASTARTNLGLGTAATTDASAYEVAGAAATAQAAAIAASQPLDSDLTAIAALSTTSYGRAFLALADAAAGRTALGLGTAATTASSDYATAAHTHTGTYQPLDSDLTSIAALSTTSFGRALLELADASAARTALGVAYGSTAGTVAQGNDSRLSDTRTPTSHASSHASAGSDPVTLAQSQVTNLTTDLAAKIPKSLVDAKGDIITATADDTPDRLAVGSNGRILTADSTQSTGIKWGFSVLSQLSIIPAVADWWSEPHDTIYTGTPSLSRVLYVPFYIPAPVSQVDGIAIEVTTVIASGLTRLGLYLPHATTHKPDARIIDGGTVDTSSGGGAAGVRTLSITATSVTPDSLVYVAVCAQTASATLRLTNAGEIIRYLGIPSSTVADVFKATNTSCFFENSVTGALPSTATPTASYSTVGQPVVALKRSA